MGFIPLHICHENYKKGTNIKVYQQKIQFSDLLTEVRLKTHNTQLQVPMLAHLSIKASMDSNLKPY